MRKKMRLVALVLSLCILIAACTGQVESEKETQKKSTKNIVAKKEESAPKDTKKKNEEEKGNNTEEAQKEEESPIFLTLNDRITLKLIGVNTEIKQQTPPKGKFIKPVFIEVDSKEGWRKIIGELNKNISLQDKNGTVYTTNTFNAVIGGGKETFGMVYDIPKDIPLEDLILTGNYKGEEVSVNLGDLPLSKE